MPLIHVKTSAKAPERPQIDAFLKELSQELATQLKKPEAYVMTLFQGELPMTFAGTLEPACFIEIKSIGTMSAAQTKSMSQAFCRRVESRLGVSPGRTYIEFNDAKGYLWGFNGETFG